MVSIRFIERRYCIGNKVKNIVWIQGLGSDCLGKSNLLHRKILFMVHFTMYQEVVNEHKEFPCKGDNCRFIPNL